MPSFDPRTTALVLIDLQNGIVAMPLQPRSGPAVVAAGKALAETFRAAQAPVVLVNVAWAPDFGDAPPSNVDQPLRAAGGMPPDWSKLVDGLAQPSDLRVTKHQWGAFTGTDLDVQLRRRGIRTIVLGGIATNFGVESTARSGWELGYSLVLAEDAMSAPTAEMHAFAVQRIFPRLGRVRKTREVLAALA
jgi:nicotinamidase-related amidase